MSTILLVENEIAKATSFSKALSDAGFCVRCEREGREALAAADSQDFDAAVVAADLPDLSEARVVQELRERDPELPIFVCADVDEATVAEWATEDRMLILDQSVDEAQLVWLLKAHVRRPT